MNALLLYPEFSALGFWNYKVVCHLMGAKYPASPLGLRSSTSYYYWRNCLAVLFRRVSSLETGVNLMAMYLHFTRQTRFVSHVMAENIKVLQAGVVGDDIDKGTPRSPSP